MMDTHPCNRLKQQLGGDLATAGGAPRSGVAERVGEEVRVEHEPLLSSGCDLGIRR